MVISSIYWTLLLFFPTLILRASESGKLSATSSQQMPQLLRIPLSLDLALHAAPGTALLLDFFLFEAKYPKRQARYGGAVVAAIAGVWYAAWVEYCASYNGTCEWSQQCNVSQSSELLCSSVPIPHVEHSTGSHRDIFRGHDICISLLSDSQRSTPMSTSQAMRPCDAVMMSN